jgi:hypothetical protein
LEEGAPGRYAPEGAQRAGMPALPGKRMRKLL